MENPTRKSPEGSLTARPSTGLPRASLLVFTGILGTFWMPPPPFSRNSASAGTPSRLAAATTAGSRLRDRLLLHLTAIFEGDASVDAVSIRRKHHVKIYLLDHAIGHCQQVRRHIQAKCFRGLEIDGEFEFCGCLYRKIIWLLAVQDAIYIRS